MISILQKPRFVPSTGDDTPAHSVFGYVWRMSGWHQAAACALALLVAGLSVAPLELQKRLINDALPAGNVDLLITLGILYAAVIASQGVLKFALRVYQGWLTESAVRYTRHHLARIHCRHGETGTSGRTVAIMGSEVDKLGGFVGESFSEPAVNGGMVVAILGYMLLVEPAVASVCAAFLVPQLLIAPVVQRRINRLLEARVGLVRELGDGVARGLPLDAVGERIDQVFGNRMRIYVFKFLLKGLIGLLNNLAPFSVLVFGGWLVIEGATSLGVVVAFMSGFDRIADPLRQLIAYYRAASQAAVRHDMIARWM